MKKLLLCILLPIVLADYKRYDGDLVIRIALPSDLLKMYVMDQNLDIWHDPVTAMDHMDVQVTLNGWEELRTVLLSEHLEYHILIDDVQKLIAAPQSTDAKRGLYELDITEYHNLATIDNWLEEVAADCGDDCATEVYGTSYDGRDLKAIKITRPGSERRAVWLDCGVHAREWIAPPTCNYAIARLIHDIDFDADVQRMREDFDWYIIPVLNVDGYDYTWTDNRMWRKTRSVNAGSTCMGADGNRNYAYEWGGASTNPCSETYQGSVPASEVEIQALENYLAPIADAFDLFISFHSYGKFLILPWGFTPDYDPEDIEVLREKADIFMDGINSYADNDYFWRSPGGIMSGSSIDWGKGAHGIKYSYLLELRDDGTHGFLLPEDQIEPQVKEVWSGLVALSEVVAADQK